MTLRWLDTLLYDLRYASRVLWRAKGFTAAAVLTLGIGIAGTTLMFALIHGVLLRPLPVLDQERLIVAWREARTSGSAQYPFGDLEIEAVAAASQLLESAAGVTRNGVARAVFTDRGISSYANLGLVTGGFFDVLGVQPVLGRTLTRDDDREGAGHVIVISHGFWQRHYGGDPGIVGRQVRLGEQALTIAGVMPPDLDYPTGVEIWQTTRSVPTDGPFGNAAQREVNLIARMRPGVSVAQASSEIIALNERLTNDAPTDYLRRGLLPVVQPFTNLVIGNVGGTMIALFAAVALVLLIASANVANLILLHGESRRGEIAIRSALGAARARIVRQVMTETAVLAVAAGIAGFALAAWSLPIVLTVIPEGLPRLESIRIDSGVVAFSIGVIFLAALVAGLAPGMLATRGDLIASLRGTATAVAGGGANRGRRVLVMTQVALAVMVIAAAGLLVRSVMNLHAIDLGLAADRLVVLDLYLPPANYRERHQRAQFLDAAIAQLEATSPIAAVTPVNVLPFTDRGWDVPLVSAEGQSADEAAANPSLNLESIHPNYFATFEIPLRAGRPFTTADREGAVAVAIVSEDAAARLWPNQDPIGKRMKMGRVDSTGRWLEIVGVAAATRYRTVTTPRPTLYLPAAQFQMTASLLVVRTAASLELLMSLASERLRGIDPNVQVMRVSTFGDHLERPLARPRLAAFLLTLFAGAALLLSAVGLHAVMAASVRQRDREIAVRLALGATAARVRRLVMAEAITLTGVGALLGAAGAMATSRLLEGMLFEVSALDPVTIGGTVLVLLGAAALASLVPLRRATRTDVMTTLRNS
jgi:putative ABC transport system permease protein